MKQVSNKNPLVRQQFMIGSNQLGIQSIQWNCVSVKVAMVMRIARRISTVQGSEIRLNLMHKSCF